MQCSEQNQGTIQLQGVRKRNFAKNTASSGTLKDKRILAFIYLFLFLLIVTGNTLTFRVFGRVAVKASDFAALLLGLILIGRFITGKISISVGIILIWGLLSFFLIFINSFIYGFTSNDLLTAVLYLFRFLYMLTLAKIVADWIRVRGLILPLLKYINCLYIATCFIGFLQLLFFPVAYDFYRIFWNFGVYFPDADPHINRLISTYFDPNYFSSCLLIGVCVNYYLMGKKDETRRKYLYWFFLGIYIITILLTKSRSGLLGFVVMTFVYGALALSRRRIAILELCAIAGAIILVMLLFMFSNISTFVRIREVFNDASAQARFDTWEKAFEIINNTHFFGIGYNLTGAYNRVIYGSVAETTGYGNDSSLLLIIITTGGAGFLLFMFHWWSLLSHKKAPACIIGLLVAALIICNFNNLLFYDLWVFPFYFIVFLTRKERKC